MASQILSIPVLAEYDYHMQRHERAKPCKTHVCISQYPNIQYPISKCAIMPLPDVHYALDTATKYFKILLNVNDLEAHIQIAPACTTNTGFFLLFFFSWTHDETQLINLKRCYIYMRKSK